MPLSHEPYFRHLARYFFAQGYDVEDLEQEARIAAWLAPHCPRVAARRQVLDIVKAAKRQKRPVLCRLTEHADPGDVVDLVHARDCLRRALASDLTPREREALGRCIRGEPIPRSDKAGQQALWRARRKVAA